MLSLEAQKQKSPQTVDVIEELLWTERTKKKEFYLGVKRSLLNLLEFSKTKLDLDSIREIYYMVALASTFRMQRSSKSRTLLSMKGMIFMDELTDCDICY